jgi:hypothetical protein
VGATNGKGGSFTIFYNPTKLKGGVDVTGSDIRPPVVGLAHEIGSVDKGFSGKLSQGNDPLSGKRREHIDGIHFENIVRDALGVPRRVDPSIPAPFMGDDTAE